MKRNPYYVFTLLMLLGCADKKPTNAEENESPSYSLTLSKAQFEANDMSLGSLEEKAFPKTISANGIIDVPPENRATVSAIKGGYIKRTPLLVGDSVKKGQPLVTLENPEFVTLQQEYLEVKGQLDYLKSEYDRHKILFDEKITSRKNYLKTESEYKTANARYNGLRKQLDMLNISPTEVENGTIRTTVTLYAPIEGSVTQVFVSKGAYVSPASPVLEIVDNDHIHLELSVFERDIMQLEKGQFITFKVPEASNQEFEAEVYLVGTTIGENRTIKVHGHLKDEKQRFLTGMFVVAKISVATEMAKALPSEALVEMEGSNYALRLVSREDDVYHFEQVKLETGSTYSGFTRVVNTENTESGNQFLVKGAFGLIGEEGGGHDH